MSFEFKEKNSYNYIYVGADNQVHIMVPISEGQEVATDNTCKATLALKKFFKPLDAMNRPIVGSALHAIDSYIQDLDQDLATLKGMNAQAIYTAKEVRRAQLLRYKDLLQEAVLKSSVDCLSWGLSSQYPDPIQHALGASPNFFTMQLSPRHPDSFLKIQSPQFSVAREEYQGLGAALREMIRTLPAVAPVTNEVALIEESVAAAAQGFQQQISGRITKDNIYDLIGYLDTALKARFPGTTLDSVNTLLASFANDEEGQDAAIGLRLVNFFESYGFFEETDLAGTRYENAGVTLELLKTIVDSVLQLQPSKSFKSQNASVLAEYIPAQSGGNAGQIPKETFSIALQMFLATLNAYCCEQNLFAEGQEKTNMAGIIEGANAGAMPQPFYIIKRPEGCVDIQSEETYNSGGQWGLCYRIELNGSCTASKKEGNAFIPAVLPANFEADILASLRAQIGAATFSWQKITVNPVSLEANLIQTIRDAILNSQPIEKSIIRFMNARLDAFHLSQPLQEEGNNILEKFSTLFHTLHYFILYIIVVTRTLISTNL